MRPVGTRAGSAPTVAISPTQPPSTFIAPVPTSPRASYATLPIRAELTPPIAGGTLAVLPDGSRAVAADPDRDAVHIVDLPIAVVRSVQLPAGSEPGRVALDRSGRAHVVLRSTGQLARIELGNAGSTLSKTLCEHPRGLAFDAAADALHLACADGALLTLDPNDYAVRARAALGRDLRDVVVGARGELFVSRFRSAELLHLSARDDVLNQDRPAQLPRPVMTYTRSASVTMVQTSATLAYRSVPAPDGELWMVHQRAQDDELEENIAYTGTLGCGPITQPSLTRFDAQGHPRDSLLVHSPASLAVDLAVSMDGQWLAMATPGAFASSRPSARLQRTQTLIDQGRIVGGMAVEELPDFQNPFCSPPNLLELARDAQAVAVAFDARGLLYIQHRVPARLDVVQPSLERGQASAITPLRVALAADVVRDMGHEIFHGDASDAGLSCASCHGEGQDDGHTWHFKGEGARRSMSLRGGVLDTLPLSWTGKFANMDTLMHDLMTRRMGGTADLPEVPVRAVGEWLQKLPALRLEPDDVSVALRGEQLFESAELGCVTCHTGPAFTNNQTVDVGTGVAMQVPSLRGVALRGPFMHDGCAPDLRDIAELRCGGAVHQAGLKRLGASEWQDLVAYLESL